MKQWLNPGGQWLITTNGYDDVGNLTSTTDPGGHFTSFSYADNYSSFAPSWPTSAYPTQITRPSTGATHVERSRFYYHSGLVAAFCGENWLVSQRLRPAISVPR